MKTQRKPRKSTPAAHLSLGSLVVATRTSGVCAAGEVGVVYEVYDRKNDDGAGDQGYGVIFENRGHDGWSMKDVEIALRALGIVDPSMGDYVFQDVGVLARDHTRGRFAQAFAMAKELIGGQPVPQNMLKQKKYPPSSALY